MWVHSDWENYKDVIESLCDLMLCVNYACITPIKSFWNLLTYTDNKRISEPYYSVKMVHQRSLKRFNINHWNFYNKIVGTKYQEVF